jgi:hypothetical protein
MKHQYSVAMFASLMIAWIAIYSGAYFGTQIKKAVGTNGKDSFIVRSYSTDWQVVAFQPAAAIESSIRRYDVQVAYEFRP